MGRQLCGVGMGTTILISTLTTLFLTVAAQDVSVSQIYPREGSINGGMQLTIFGKGFAKNLFNYGAGSEHLGNKVRMVSVTRSYECEIHKDGCTELQIMCYTKAMVVDDYDVRVTIDGEDVPTSLHCASNPNNCIFKPSSSRTPQLATVTPGTIPPGSLLTFTGKLITDRLGSHQASSSNGQTELMLRVYAGGQQCELMEDFDLSVPYGIQLNNDGLSQYGYMMCKLVGSYVSNLNVSFIVEPPYGRSFPDLSVLKLFADDSIAMVQTYARIDSVSPSIGSTAGGTKLTIEGDNFDETDKPIQVYIAGSACYVTALEKTRIECMTPPKPDVSAPYQGSRGLDHVMTSSEASIAEVTTVLAQLNQTSVIDTFAFAYNASASTQTTGMLVVPHTGQYKFEVAGRRSTVKLSLSTTKHAENKSVVVDENFSSSQTQNKLSEEKYDLVADLEYFIELLHSSTSDNDNSVSVNLRMYNTDKTSSQTGSAVNEQQKLTVKSRIVPETQNISFANWDSQGHVNEVQTIEIVPTTYGYPSEIRLGMDGLFSGQVSTESSEGTIESALNSLSTIAPDTVSVTRSNTDGVYLFTVTFNSERGRWSPISYIAYEPQAVNITVNTVIEGVPSYDVAVLKLDKRLTKPVSTSASEEQMKIAVEDLFSVSCPGSITSRSGWKLFDNFEGQDGWQSKYGGHVIKNQYPMCGRQCLRSPTNIINMGESGEFVSNNHYICFGYLGFLNNRISIRFDYVQDNELIVKWKSFGFEFMPYDGQWHYICMDVHAMLTTAYPDGNYLRIYQVQVTRDGTRDTYFDEIYFGSKMIEEPDIHNLRLMPPRNYLMNDVEVLLSAEGNYTVKLFPVNCSAPFSMITMNNGPSDVVRVDPSSGPITGTFNVGYGGRWTKGIPADATPEKLKASLETLPGIGALDVRREGLCDAYVWTVDFLQVGGDRPPLLLNTSNVQGVEAEITQSTTIDGHAEFRPMIGDMLSQSRVDPPVTVSVNGIPSICNGACDFEWSESATPTVVSVTPTSGDGDVTLTIEGTGLVADAQVLVGYDECTDMAMSGSALTCNCIVTSRGVHDIAVYVNGKGRAVGDLTYEFESVVSTVTPSTGHLSGGYLVTLAGSGLAADMTVQYGSQVCQVLSDESNSDQVVCVMQSDAAPGPVDFVLGFSDLTSLIVPDAFTFENSVGSSVVGSISASTSSVAGGIEMTITGSGFGADVSEVYIGYGNQADVTSWSDTEITIVLPPLEPAMYTLLISTLSGYADLTSNSIPDINYQLEITSLSPETTSKYGGTRHTITGAGFGTSTEGLSVMVGEVDCEIVEVIDTEIVCVLKPLTAHHVVDNFGSHPQYGQFYAWNPSTLEVQVGDTVEWSWSFPSEIADVQCTVQQTDDVDSVSAAENGFGSVLKASSRGSYSYEFTQEGEFFFSSGPVTGGLIMRGAVMVQAKDDWSGDLKVMREGYLADFNMAARKRRDIRVKRDACVPEEPACPPDSNVEEIETCENEVVVNSISPNSGTSQEIITLTGQGFSLSDCNNIIMFGETPCTVLSSTEAEVQCQLSVTTEVPPGVVLPASVVVDNLGNARLNLTGEGNKGYKLIPRVTELSYSSGSLEGGQLLNITGEAFVKDGGTRVTIGFVPCDIQTVTYNEITCLTEKAGAWSGNITVTVLSTINKQIEAVCTEDVCMYSYSSAQTPQLLTVSPQNISGAADLMITGSLFHTDMANMEVYVGGTECVGTASDTQIDCSVVALPAGMHAVSARRPDKGFAAFTREVNGPLALYVNSQALSTSVTPSTSSVEGGLEVTIAGNGYHGITSVSIDGSPCVVTSVDTTEVVCSTPAHAEGQVQVIVTSNEIEFPPVEMMYSVASTPTITNVDPQSGYTGDTITITGTLLENVADVSLDSANCAVLSATETEITCTLGEHAAGRTDLVVTVAGLGRTAAVPFTFTLDVDSVSPDRGSFAGGQVITVAGAGLDDTVAIRICGELCVNSLSVPVTPSQVVCTTPAHDVEANDVSCDVVVSLSTETATITTGYTYDVTIDGTVSSVSPTRGGTAGGTSLTISGSNLNHADASVSIDGVDCEIQNKNDTAIVCKTGAHAISGRFDVKVLLGADGLALTQGAAEFYYIDVWSSLFTWGGGPLPAEGEIVVVRENQTLLLDMDTPILKVLLIQGGKLLFDEKDVELNAENILITDGGVLEVGTEAEPFQHKGIITMHGHLRSLEMPIYGAKTLALRNGTLDLHGIPKVSWTVLGNAVDAGDDTITLQQAVDWEVGDHIVIASTGKRHSQKENEKRMITEVSNGGTTLKLNASLEYSHLGTTMDIGGGHTLEMRAEVGLLTHNVVVRGSINHQWDEKIEACAKGFDTGQFATQTCFQGRFGEEMGSDEFGAAIMMHAPEPDMQWVVGRLSHIEVTHAGQAFRLGRYPIHFHLNGHQNKSYVKGCSVHKTFNRAINIHNTHDVLIENNVIYHVKGGAVFFEDSVETGNILQYNLAVFVISSTSLLNDDITPAAFWLTHPNNIVRHNHAAGGSHFGYWYRMHSHPTGPSADNSLCPKNAPLGEFWNNTAHSLGWFGLWTFPDYFPMDGEGVCSKRTKNIPAVFDGLKAWHCEKGAEYVNGGDLQFVNFVMANNEKAGIEGKINLQHTQFSPVGPLIKDSLITAHSGTGGCTRRGIILPFSGGLTIDNTEFLGFNSSSCVALGLTKIDGKCSTGCGGYTYMFSNITKTDSPAMAAYRWEHEAAFHDLDGTLTGVADAKVVPSNPSLNPSICYASNEWSAGIPGSICETPNPFHRYAWNNALPSSLQFKNALLSNEHGTSVVPWLKKRLTHPKGWMLMLMGHTSYNLTYENGEHFTNTSNTGKFYMFDDEDYVIMGQQLYQRPDKFRVAGAEESDGSENELTYEDNNHGDWYLSEDLQFSYIVSGKESISKRSIGYGTDRSVNFKVYTCYFNDCVPPPDPNQVPPPTKRPDDAIFWSKDTAWESAEDGWGGNNGDGTFSPPEANTDVKILNDDWVVLDTQPNVINKLYIYGVLEFEPAKINGAYMDFKLSATHILLFGGRLFVGWEDNPMKGNVEIMLRGDWSTEEQYMPFGGPTVGAKAIGVFGSLDIHGMERNIYWTRLSETADAGSLNIVLAEPVDWVAGDEIVITTTGLSAWESEVRKIEAVANGITLTLNSSLSYKHTAIDHTVRGYSFNMSAEVGLLTRNVKIKGEAHSDLQKQSFGGRILISDYFDGSQQWTGYARISNTEFYHMGQEGYIDYWDPRFALTYLNTGPVMNNKPSYIKQNSFKDSFNTAIGVIDGHGILVEDNVVHGTVEAGIRIKSTNSTLNRNLVSFAQARACYQEREEISNIFFHGSIEIMDATGVIMTDNAVAGSERSGYSVAGYACDVETVWSGNVAHGVLSGVVILPEYPAPSPCARVSGFTVYNALDYGVYTQAASVMELEDLILADNSVGIFSLNIGPGALSHITSDKYIKVSNSLIVGSTDERDCNLDYTADPDGCNFISSANGRSWNSESGGTVGMAFGQFMGGSNKAPFKPWNGLMSYNSNGGLTLVDGVTFANFKTTCGSSRDYMFTTSPGNEDLQHPMEVSNLVLINVDKESKVFYHRPNVGKINSADCVDMDCDAKKKCMIKDLDGSFLGGIGAVIPQSEFEWGGDPRRGLGDYRIPKTLLTDLEGNRLNVDDVAPYKGVIDNQACEYMDEWNAYSCVGNKNYEMLVIESMDPDTETRRLSPVAVLGEKYIDLINGPQDHGWCSGYTCRKRVSTFMALVATDVHYALYFTSTSPQHLRLTMLNAGPSEKITLEIYYTISNRIDVYIDGIYIAPLNAAMVDGKMVYNSPEFYCQYCPQEQDSNIHGANFQNRWEQLMFVAMDGSAALDIKMSNMIMLTFDLVMTEDEFFGEELASNLAIFFGVDPSKIRVVNVISEDTQLSAKRRRKRALQPGHITVEFEIGDSPTIGINDTITDGLTTQQLLDMRQELIDAVQTGNLSSQIGVSFSKVYVTVPLPDPGDPEWDLVAGDAADYDDEVRLPSKVATHNHPADIPEASVFTANVMLLNDEDELVIQFGSIDWRVSVRLTSTGNDDAVFTGTREVVLVDGWANFTDLSISHPGSGFTLEYYISSPADVIYVDAVSAPFVVSKRELDLLVSMEDRMTANETADIDLTLVQYGTTIPISSWNGLGFRAFVTLNPIIDYGDGELIASTSNIFHTMDGNVSVPIELSQQNAYVLSVKVASYPDSSYGITVTSDIVYVYSADYVAPYPTVTKNISLVFEGTAATIGAMNVIYFEAALFNELMQNYENVVIGPVDCNNDLKCEFQMSGDADVVDDNLLALWEAVKGPMEVVVGGETLSSAEEMTVNGEDYSSSDGPPPVEKLDDVLIIYIIIGATTVVLLLIIIVTTVILYRMKTRHNKINQSPRSMSPDMPMAEIEIAYVGAPPISSKMPPIDSKRAELERANEKLQNMYLTEKPPPPISQTQVKVKPYQAPPRWKY